MANGLCHIDAQIFGGFNLKEMGERGINGLPQPVCNCHGNVGQHLNILGQFAGDEAQTTNAEAHILFTEKAHRCSGHDLALGTCNAV